MWLVWIVLHRVAVRPQGTVALGDTWSIYLTQTT